MILTGDHIQILVGHSYAMGLDNQTVMNFNGKESLVDSPGHRFATELSALTETTFTVSYVLYRKTPKKKSPARTPLTSKKKFSASDPLTHEIVGNEMILRRYLPGWVEPKPRIFR
jgi:hypothetical protein